MPETQQSSACSIDFKKKTPIDKANEKLANFAPWMDSQIHAWLEKRPTGSAIITIEIAVNQGGIRGISRCFAIKEGL